MLQQARELGGGRTLFAREARAVVKNRWFAAQALAPPLLHHSTRARRRAYPALLQAQGEKQLLRHHVVAEFVDVTNDFGQGR